MISTNLVELLRDISLKLGILIKTSDLPKSTSRSQQQLVNTTTSTYTNQTNYCSNTDIDQVEIASPETSENKQTNQQPKQQQQNQVQNITNSTSTQEGIQSMSAKSMPTIVNNNNSNNNNHHSHDYNYIYNKSTSCNSTRASIGSDLEQDEVRSVIVTGCGSKIGRKIATAFAKLDFNIALVDFNTKQTEFVAEECQEASPKNRIPLQIIADISQLDEAHKVIDRAVKEFGRLDVLVNTINNAALMDAHFTGGQSDDDPHVFEQYHRIIANNMHSVTYLCISAAPHLRRSKGSIVNVSSISENDHGSYKFAYCMSKAGIWTLTKCLATDYAPDINMICVSDQPTQSQSSTNETKLPSATLSSGKSNLNKSSPTTKSHSKETIDKSEITIEKSTSTMTNDHQQQHTLTNNLTRRQSEPDFFCQTVNTE